MKTITPILIFGFVFALLVLWFFGKTAKPGAGTEGPINQVIFKASNTKVKVEIADTEAKRAKGLMFRNHLPQDSGMLFIFQTEATHSFWMANTRIPLDIIWLDRKLKIVDVSKNTPPCTETGTLTSLCKAYTPKEKAMYVLEVNGGYTNRHNIGIDSYVEFVNTSQEL